MTKELLLENYLLLVKSTIEVYVHGTIESSNKEVRELLHDGLNEMLKHQENVYNELINNNYYVVDNINSSAINKVINKINKD